MKTFPFPALGTLLPLAACETSGENRVTFSARTLNAIPEIPVDFSAMDADAFDVTTTDRIGTFRIRRTTTVDMKRAFRLIVVPHDASAQPQFPTAPGAATRPDISPPRGWTTPAPPPPAAAADRLGS